MEPAAKRLLIEHLPYELNMLESAMVFLTSATFSEYRKQPFLRNCAIEAFWTHARNLNEFMAKARNPNASGVAAARDFTVTEDRMKYELDEELRNKINSQISHLRYERATTNDEKLVTTDMLRVYAAINSVMKEFEDRLAQEAKEIWKPRHPTEFITAVDFPQSTNATTSETLFVRQVI